MEILNLLSILFFRLICKFYWIGKFLLHSLVQKFEASV